jgi:hypothetical protein
MADNGQKIIALDKRHMDAMGHKDIWRPLQFWHLLYRRLC